MEFQRLLVGLVEFCRRHAVLVFAAALALTVFAGFFAAGHLGISTDTDEMFAQSLPWRQRALALKGEFPQFTDVLAVVIDAKEPEEAEATAAALAKVLAADHGHFRAVSRPDSSPFLNKEGLLFLDVKQLEGLLERTIDAQPFLGQLAKDPSARGLFAALALLGQGLQRAQVDLAPYRTALAAFHQEMAAALAGHPQPLSWTKLIGGSLADLGGPYKFVLAQPRVDTAALQPGGAATAAIRAAAANLEFVKSGDARVRITGNVALADEEFASVAQGAAAGLAGSIVLISLWLFLAVRSWRLIVPILLTLVLGLMLTLLFAAAAVGTLNLVSVGFGILFVGIAVDFAIQFCVRYREITLESPDPGTAIRETGRRVGGQILVAAAATSAGFLAFVPTDFRGVAELGLIAGVGMLIAFVCTLTFLPAAISVFRPPSERAEVGFRWAAPLDDVVRRRRRPLLAVFATLAAAGVLLVPRLSFDSDPLHTKNPNTEAMRTLYDLMDSPLTNPFTIDILAPNTTEAAALAERLRHLPLVSGVLSIDSFVPKDQKAKLAQIEDAATLLGPTLTPYKPAPPPTAEGIRSAAINAVEALAPALAKSLPDPQLAAIASDLRRLAAAPDRTVFAVNEALTRFLPAQLDQLRAALSAGPVSLQSIPASLARDWLLPDGRARIQVLPKPAARNSRGLAQFVDEVTAIAPDAGGSAVTIEATSATIVGSFRSAAIAAVLAIAVILFVALRRALDVGLVLAPLLLSALMTVIVMVAVRLPLNYANIIALPLLLGVGVSFNIYFVMNWRAGRISMLGSATARAILFSALTTGTAFGSLALSAHPGTASMGKLLLISLACTLVASLVFVPALLASMPRPAADDRAKIELPRPRLGRRGIDLEGRD
ncbi:MAG TPA: MMPL family transporter [Stellaceae bacterium]|jgi:hopanoid biosynthesis associated RND transporter like protein HpnN|nr:MMPL family transporter [Stellaceae bacterium]